MDVSKIFETLIAGTIAGGLAMYGAQQSVKTELLALREDVREVKKDVSEMRKDFYVPRGKKTSFASKVL